MEFAIEQQVISKYIEESNHLRGIFPEELWEMILEKINLPDTKQNLSNASPYFRHWFLPQRVMFLFPKVFEIFAERKHCASVKTDFIFQPNTFMLLKLRQICQSWLNDVNTFYQKHATLEVSSPDLLNVFQTQQSASISDSIKTVFRPGVSPEGRDICQQFMLHFWPTHKFENEDSSPFNPFISKAIKINFTTQVKSSIQRYIFGMHQVLGRYGHHLWHCEISLEDSFAEDPISCYVNLVAWLISMPNLKTLSIKYGRISNCEAEWNRATYHLFPSPYESNMLQDMVKRMPMPKLQNLEFLRISGLPSIIANELIYKNSHISSLDCDPTYRVKFHEKYDLCSKSFENLKKLKVVFSSVEDLKILRTMHNASNLESLTVEPSNCSQNPLEISFNGCVRMFRILSQITFPTLKTLVISLPYLNTEHNYPTNRYQLSRLSLNLPQIQNLKLTLKNWLPLDFILPIRKSLQTFHITLDIPSFNCKASNVVQRRNMAALETIQFLGIIPLGNKGMERSNIWRIVPNLQDLLLDYNHHAVESLSPNVKQRRYSE